MARTTNRLEGGVNSPLKHVLLDHHGPPEEHTRRAREWVCYMKSGNPDPASLIKPEHWKPAKAVPEPDGDDAGPRSYATGIQAHNHAAPASEPGFYIRKGHVR